MVQAAAFASMPPRQLRELLDDEDFRELVEAEREQLALAPEEWQREMELDNRQAIERALADGRVSIVGQLLRAWARLAGAGEERGRAQGGRADAARLEEEAEDRGRGT